MRDQSRHNTGALRTGHQEALASFKALDRDRDGVISEAEWFHGIETGVISCPQPGSSPKPGDVAEGGGGAVGTPLKPLRGLYN